jgi:acetylornithine/N-succinyldiaminopimelate aminotransferase
VISAAASAVLDTIDDEAFLATVRERGKRLSDGLSELRLGPRGLGLMIGIHVPRAPEVARRLLLEQRLVVNATGPDTIRLLPPLTVSEEEIDEALSRIGALLASPAA